MEVRCNPFSQLTIKGRLCHEFAAALLEIQKRNTTHEIQNTKEFVLYNSANKLDNCPHNLLPLRQKRNKEHFDNNRMLNLKKGNICNVA